ncbi:MAG: hypothetical protein RL321_216 [Pseudomonadota bacterium]
MTSRFFFGLSVLSCLSLVAASTRAHEIDEGLELGAHIAVVSASPVRATLSLKPRIAFKTAKVELPNAIGGAIQACEFGNLVAGQTYRCDITGDVADEDTGLVIAISGIRATPIPGHDDLSYKAFTVPNPRYNALAQAQRKTEQLRKRATTLDSKPASVRQ